MAPKGKAAGKGGKGGDEEGDASGTCNQARAAAALSQQRARCGMRRLSRSAAPRRAGQGAPHHVREAEQDPRGAR
jgi:hypothetical protein